MPDTYAADKAPIVGPDRVRDTVQAILRAAQAKYTDAQLEALSGVNARAIKSYRVEGREPSLSAALSLGCVLGKDGLNAILALIGYSATALDEADTLNPGMIIATMLPHVATIATAAADGRIDHIELPGCRVAADQIIATVLPLSSAGEAA